MGILTPVCSVYLPVSNLILLSVLELMKILTNYSACLPVSFVFPTGPMAVLTVYSVYLPVSHIYHLLFLIRPMTVLTICFMYLSVSYLCHLAFLLD